MQFRTSKVASEIGMKPRWLGRSAIITHSTPTTAIRRQVPKSAKPSFPAFHCLLSRRGALSCGVNMASNLAKRAFRVVALGRLFRWRRSQSGCCLRRASRICGAKFGVGVDLVASWLRIHRMAG